LNQIEVKLNEKFFAAELHLSIGKLKKNIVVIDEDAPTKERVKRLSADEVSTQLRKRGIKVSGTEAYQRDKLIEVMKTEKDESAKK
jgi:hypothetical protein